MHEKVVKWGWEGVLGAATHNNVLSWIGGLFRGWE